MLDLNIDIQVSPSCQRPSFWKTAQALGSRCLQLVTSSIRIENVFLGFQVISFPFADWCRFLFVRYPVRISIRLPVIRTFIRGFPRTLQVTTDTGFKSVMTALLPKFWLFITQDHHPFTLDNLTSPSPLQLTLSLYLLGKYPQRCKST